MFSKDAFARYVAGSKYLLKLQWQTSRWVTVLQLLTSIIQGVSQIGSSYFNALILSQFALLVVGQSSVRTIMIAVVARIVYQFVVNGIYSLDNYLSVRVSNLMRLGIEEDILTKLHSLDQEQVESEKYTPVITRVSEQLQRMGFITREFSSFVGEIFGFGAAIISLFVIEPLLGLLVLAIVFPLISLEIRATKWQRDSYERTETDYRIRYTLRWYMAEHKYIPEIKMLNGLPNMLKVFRYHNRKIQSDEEEIAYKELKLRTINDFSQLVVLLGSDIWLVFKAAAQAMPLDTILFTRNLIQNAVNSSGQIARSSQRLSEGIVYLGDLQEFFSFEPAIKDRGHKLPSSEMLNIEFKDVSFSYPDTNTEVLNNVSFKVNADEKVALVGLNGAGKSTIVKLLLREYLPTSGEILINGRPLLDYDYRSFISHVAVLMQDFVAVNAMTIRQNISLGNGDMRDEEIFAALKVVGMDKFIKKLDLGLDQRLNNSFKDGVMLSGGQLQRMFIARALLRNADFLVLDEPTSAIDARTEHEIFKELFNQNVRRSTLIISHRFSTVRQADTIIVLDGGQIAESGTHKQLMKNNGLYHELFTKQAEGYK